MLIRLESNYTQKNLLRFLNELNTSNKINKICIALNSVGNSSAYGYSYGYSYGYKYGYKYGYNYGYGYGYEEDK